MNEHGKFYGFARTAGRIAIVGLAAVGAVAVGKKISEASKS